MKEGISIVFLLLKVDSVSQAEARYVFSKTCARAKQTERSRDAQETSFIFLLGSSHELEGGKYIKVYFNMRGWEILNTEVFNVKNVKAMKISYQDPRAVLKFLDVPSFLNGDPIAVLYYLSYHFGPAVLGWMMLSVEIEWGRLLSDKNKFCILCGHHKV